MADLNPIIQPNLSLERPIAEPSGVVDIAGAIAPLVSVGLSALDSGQQGQGGGLSSGDKKDLALQPLFNTIKDWSNSDMAPQDLVENVRGITLEYLAQYPQYRTDILSAMEVTGTEAPVQPTTSDDAYTAQYNEWIQTPDGVAAMISSAQYTGGQLDNPATALEVQRRFQQAMADEAAANARANRLARVEGDQKLYDAEVTSIVRDISPAWNAATNDLLGGVFSAAAQGDPRYDTPEEQVAAVSQLRMMREMQIRDNALANGLTNPKDYEEQMAGALAPFDSMLNSLSNQSDAATNLVNVYKKAHELKRDQMFIELLGPMLGAAPEVQRVYAELLTSTVLTGEKLEEHLKAIEAQSGMGYPDHVSIFPELSVDPATAVQTETKPSEGTFEDMSPEELEAQINLGVEQASAGSDDPRVTLNGFATAVGAANASEGAAHTDLLKGILNPTVIRKLADMGGDSNGQDARALAANLAGEQVRRNMSIINGIAGEDGPYSVEYNEAGKLVVLRDGKPRLEATNAMGRERELFEAVNNINFLNSSLARVQGVGEAVTSYTKSMVAGEEPALTTTSQVALQTLADRQGEQPAAPQAAPPTATLDLENVQNLAPTGFQVAPPEVAIEAESAAIHTGNAVGTAVVPSYGYTPRPDFEASVAAGRSSPHWNTAVTTARKYGIPEQILTRLITAESSWRADLGENSAGAAGLAQFLEDTAAEYGIDRMNPEQALDGAARYLNKMYNKYGRWDYALAAYNAGPGAVDKHNGIPPFAETQDYVSKILGGIGGSAGVGYSEYRTGPAQPPVDYTPVPLPTNINTRSGVLYNSLEGASSMTKPYAADNMNFILNGPFQQMQAMFGAELTINDAIAKAGTSRETQTTGSQHFHGNALDISLAGMSDEEKQRVFQSALAAGFTGFGFGNGILHVDIGPKRSWAYGNSSFGGVLLSEVQAMVNGSANNPLTPDQPAGAQDRLILPSNWNQGQGSDVNLWQPDADPDEGEVSDFMPVRGAGNEQPVVPQGNEEAPQVVDPAQQQGGQAQPTASQSAVEELDDRTKAVLRKGGINFQDMKKYGSEAEATTALESGEIQDGDVVNIGGNLVVIEEE